jgi:hypothetical protein
MMLITLLLFAIFYILWPRARKSKRIDSIPSLSMVLMPLEDTNKRTKRFSAATQKRFQRALVLKDRRTFLLQCATLFPRVVPLAVTMHSLAIFNLPNGNVHLGQDIYQIFEHLANLF